MDCVLLGYLSCLLSRLFVSYFRVACPLGAMLLSDLGTEIVLQLTTFAVVASNEHTN